MTSMSHLYRELGGGPPKRAPQEVLEEDEVEDIQLDAFDSGYKAGWEDALKIHETSVEQTGAALAQNLQDMAFTHHEVYLKFSAAMKPLFEQIIDKMLPAIARQVLGLHILEQLDGLMGDHVKTALEIAVCPDDIDSLRAALEDMAPMPFTLTPDPLMAGGQALLRVGDQEREINLGAVLSGVSEAVEAFFEQTKQGVTR